MTNSKTSKRALVLSLLSLLLCCSMLVGTTFAWFTDSVTSGVNKIVAGNLDVDVFYGDPAQKQSIEGVSTLFNDVTLWEPGAVAYENLTVANLGTLALKYELSVSFANYNYVMVDGEPEYCLPDILKVGLVSGGIDSDLERDEVVAQVSEWYPMQSYTFEDPMPLLGGENAETVGVVIWWEPSAEDNNWNLNNGKVTDDGTDYLYVDLGITMLATQLVHEEDSFDNKYDEEAEIPEGVTMYPGENGPKILKSGRVTVFLENVPAGFYTLGRPEDKPNDSYVRTEDEVELNTDFYVLKDGAPTEGVEYKVQIQLDTMSTINAVTHNGEPVQNYTYDPFYDVITFTTDSFSPFAVDYTIFGEAVDFSAEKREIYSGLFTEVDPATLDASLTNGAYMVVDFEKDGKTVYSVSEKATTVIVGNSESNYECTYGDVVSVTVDSYNKLYSIISGLQNNDHSTVYLLPGTYNEATTINVYSSMNIIGLGDAEDIQVKKVGCHSTTTKKPSNRHLFNCNGTMAEYIEVTIRNLHLDATEQNSYMKVFFGKETKTYEDNAAVQSIRKSKVKCYDLNIIKGTNMADKVFYVNGNNAVDGVKYTAYMYVEDCTLNSTNANSVVDTSGYYKFYHSGLTYNGTAYTKNSGSIKNTTMEWNDWWD